MGGSGMTAPAREIAEQSFGTAFRGFDRTEVRKFLSEIGAQQQALVDQAARAESRLEDLRSRLASVEQLLETADQKYQAAQAHLAEIESERAEEGAANPPPDPELEAVKVFGERVTEVLQIAVAAGNSIREEAETWALQHRDQAEQDAANAIASARREVAEIVAREETTVDQLRATEQALRNWLEAAHSAIGQVLEQAAVGPGDLAAVLGRIRELGPSSEPRQVEEAAESAESAADSDEASEFQLVDEAVPPPISAERPQAGLLIN